MKKSTLLRAEDYMQANYLSDSTVLRAGGDPFLAFLNGQRVYDWLSVHVPEHCYGDILDVGCGDGRVAAAFGRDKSYEGRYFGFDINRDRIEALKNIFAERKKFEFGYADIAHSYYNPTGRLSPLEFRYSEAEVQGAFDLIIYNSIFSHMAVCAIKRHLQEAVKYLRVNGRIWLTGYMLDNEMVDGFSNKYWAFCTPYDLGFSAIPKNPEGCVAFHERIWHEIVSEVNLVFIHIIRGYWQTSTRSLDQHKQDVMILGIH
ncbi:MAG: class I SAM-dependent methyltransferase [Nitrospirales bacterium]